MKQDVPFLRLAFAPELDIHLAPLEMERKKVRNRVACTHAAGLLILVPWIASILRNGNFDQAVFMVLWGLGWFFLVKHLKQPYHRICQTSILQSLRQKYGVAEAADDKGSAIDLDESRLFPVKVHTCEAEDIFSTVIGEDRFHLSSVKAYGLATHSETTKLMLAVATLLEGTRDPHDSRSHQHSLSDPEPCVFFNGLFGMTAFTESFCGLTRIHYSPLRALLGARLSRVLQRWFSGDMILVTTAHPAFEKRFVVHTLAPEQSTRLLDREFTDQVVRLHKSIKKKMAFSFVRHGAYLAIHCRGAVIAPPLWSTLADRRWISAYDSLFQDLLAWARALHTQQCRWVVPAEERSRLDHLEDVLAAMR